MEVQIQLVEGGIDTQHPLPPGLEGRAGAVVEFRGVVRGEEAGCAIAALEYEAYAPMAERVMRELLQDIGRRHPCLLVRVVHRVGVVPVGETALHVWVAAAHRAEAMALLTEFVDRLKQDVPIWKRRALEPGPRQDAHAR